MSKDRDALRTAAFVILGPLCCLGPLLIGLALSAGMGAVLLLAGAGLLVAASGTIVGFLLVRWRRERSAHELARPAHPAEAPLVSRREP